MNGEHLFEPYFSGEPVNHLNYLAMLENWFIPQLQSLEIESNVWFKQNGAPAYFAITLKEYLNAVFPRSCVGRGSGTSPTPLNRPTQSPDLTSCVNFLWDFAKEKVAQQRYTNTDELKQAVTDAFNEVTPRKPWRMLNRT